MVANTDIKFYVNTNNSAPTLSNIWGSLVSLLDTCLVSGYGYQDISSATVLDNILTITFPSPHKLLAGQVIALSGSINIEFNKQYRIAIVNSDTTLQIDLEGVENTILEGTMQVNLPGLGWIPELSQGGKRAYRNADVNDTDRPYLRVVDEIDPVWTSSYAKYGKVGIVDSLEDINTLVGVQTPFDPVSPNKNWVGTGTGGNAYNGWAKWYYARIQDVFVGNWYDSEGASEGVRNWMLVGNSDWFYILPSVIPSSTYCNIYFFGKLQGDVDYTYGLSSSVQYDTAQNNKATTVKTPLSSRVPLFFLHGNTSGKAALSLYNGRDFAPSGSSSAFPSILDSLLLSNIYISEKSFQNNPLIEMPSFKWLLNSYESGYDVKVMQENKKLILLKDVCASNLPDNKTLGSVAFMLT